ncbi:MAG: O-antigen ligase family protein [Bdellovibrionia bacterium]
MSITARLPICSTKSLSLLFALYGALTLTSMAWMNVGAGILFLAIVFTRTESQPQESLPQASSERHLRTYFLSSMALALSCAVSLLAADWFPLSWAGKSVSVHFFKDLAKTWYLFWPCVLVIGLKRLQTAEQRQVLKTWLLVFFLLSGLGVFQYFWGWPRPQNIPSEPGRFHATLFLGHHLSVASILIFPFFVALDTLLWRFRGILTPLPQLPTFIGILLGLSTLFLTYSRTLWLALPLGIGLWILLSLPQRKKPLSIFLLIAFGVSLTQIPSVQNRLKTSIGIGPRQELWSANLEFFNQRPWTGVGFRKNEELSGYYLVEKFKSSDVFAGHAHNNALEVLAGTGLIGLMSWLLWCGVVIAILLRKRKITSDPFPMSRALLCAWVVFHLNGLTQVNFWEGKVEHQLAWVIAWSLL